MIKNYMNIHTLLVFCFFVASVVCGGCTPIQVKETIVDLERHTAYEPVPDSGKTDVVSQCELTDKMEIACAFSYRESEAENKTEFVRQKKIVTKKANLLHQIIYYSAGGTLLAIGTGITADAHNVPLYKDQETDNKYSRKTAYSIGIGTMAVGAALTTLGVVGSVRAKNTTEELPSEKRILDTRTIIVTEGSWANKTVHISVGDTVIHERKTDETGKILIPIEALYAESTLLQTEDVTDLGILSETQGAAQLSVTAYPYHSCGADARKLNLATTVDELSKYFTACPASVSWLTENEVWIAAATLYGQQVDKTCESPSTVEEVERCTTFYQQLTENVPAELISPEGQESFELIKTKLTEKKKRKSGKK